MLSQSTSAIAELDYFFYVVTWFGFQLIHEDLEYYTFQYSLNKDSTLYLFIQRNQDRYVIASHIEVGVHHRRLRNQISTSLLSELHVLLKREFPYVPIYITYLSELGKEVFLNKGDNFQSSSNSTSKLSPDVVKHFNKALKSAVGAATRIFVKEDSLLDRGAVISLVYEYVLKDLNLSLVHATFFDELERFIHQCINKTLSEIKQGYQLRIDEKGGRIQSKI